MSSARRGLIIDCLIYLALGALVLWMCTGCASAPTPMATPKKPMPSFKRLPNYMTRDACDAFSREAVAMLQARGIEARRITYRWWVFGERGAHAAVLFKLNGKFYFMDNWRMGPVPVAGETDLGCVRHVNTRPDYMARMADEFGFHQEPRKMAELFASPPAWMRSIQVGVNE